MIGLVLEWWWLFALVFLPEVFRLIAGLIVRVVASRLDHHIPDELPMTAGEWLEERLTQLEGTSDMRVAATRSNEIIEGAYLRTARLFRLGKATYFKRDPVFWAIAAHELGHVQTRQHHPIAFALLDVGKWIRWGLATIGLALLLGNVLYAIPIAMDLAFYFLTAAVALKACSLVSESSASRWAIAALRDSDTLSSRHLRAVKIVLVYAFFTYFATFLAHVVMLSQWHWVVDIVAGTSFSGVVAGLAWWQVGLAGLISLMALVHVGTVVMCIGSPMPVHVDADERRLDLSSFRSWTATLWNLAILGLIWLAWDQSGSAVYRWLVLVAFIPVAGTAMRPLRIPFAPIVWALALGQRSLVKRYGGVHESERYLADIRPSKLEQGTAAWASAIEELDNNPPLPQRLASLARLAYVPLLVAFWVTMF